MNVIILIGTNKGDRLFNLSEAVRRIRERAGKITALSHIYETEAWGNTEQPGFYNMGIGIETKLPPDDLMDTLLDIEKQMGRVRVQKWEERIIDLDIIYYGNEIISSDKVTVPHPEMQKRRFVLEPLMEIAADFQHPVYRKDSRTLLAECSDELKVTRLGVLPL